MMTSFVAYLVIMLITMIAGISIVLPEIGRHVFTLQVALIWLFPLREISGATLEAWYLILVAAIGMSAVYVFVRSSTGFFREVTGRGAPRNHSALFDISGLMFAVFFVNAAIVLLMTLAGSEPTVPSEGAEDWEMLFLLANASVWEEIIIRVLLIGMPLLVIHQFRQNGTVRLRQLLLGGGIDIRWAEAALILLSASVFGIAHYWSWGLWKVFPSGLAGIAFGYVFLRHGLTASILLHFSFDYLSMPITLFDPSLGAQIGFGLAVILWLAVGAVFAVYFTVRMTEFVAKTTFLDDPIDLAMASQHRAAPAGVRSADTWAPQGGSGGAYVPDAPRSPRAVAPPRSAWFTCPFCGSAEAKWQDGRFQCLGCGRLFQ